MKTDGTRPRDRPPVNRGSVTRSGGVFYFRSRGKTISVIVRIISKSRFMTAMSPLCKATRANVLISTKASSNVGSIGGLVSLIQKPCVAAVASIYGVDLFRTNIALSRLVDS